MPAPAQDLPSSLRPSKYSHCEWTTRSAAAQPLIINLDKSGAHWTPLWRSPRRHRRRPRAGTVRQRFYTCLWYCSGGRMVYTGPWRLSDEENERLGVRRALVHRAARPRPRVPGTCTGTRHRPSLSSVPVQPNPAQPSPAHIATPQASDPSARPPGSPPLCYTRVDINVTATK